MTNEEIIKRFNFDIELFSNNGFYFLDLGNIQSKYFSNFISLVIKDILENLGYTFNMDISLYKEQLYLAKTMYLNLYTKYFVFTNMYYTSAKYKSQSDDERIPILYNKVPEYLFNYKLKKENTNDY